MDDGEHTVVIDAKDAIGLAAEQKKWSFTVTIFYTWEETWSQNPWSISVDDTVTTPEWSIKHEYPVIGDHRWRGYFTAYYFYSVDTRLYRGKVLYGWQEGTMGSYSADASSSGGISLNANVSCRIVVPDDASGWSKPKVNSCRYYAAASVSFSASTSDFYLLKITKNSQLIFSGSGAGRVTLDLWTKSDSIELFQLSPGVYDLSPYEGYRIGEMVAIAGHASAFTPHCPPKGSMQRASKSLSGSVGKIRITNLEQAHYD